METIVFLLKLTVSRASRFAPHHANE